MNRQITKSEIESIIIIIIVIIIKLPTNKSARPEHFTGEFYQTFKELKLVLLKLFQKIKKKGILPNSSVKPPSPLYQNHSKIP